MANELPKRSEVKEAFTWNVADMYADVAAWESDIEAIKKIVASIVEKKGSVTASAKELFDTLEKMAQFGQKLDLVFNYAERLADQDTKDMVHQEMQQRVLGMAAQIGSQLAFVEPEILEMEEETLARYYEELPALQFYKKQIEEIQRLKSHCLTTEMEELLAMAAEVNNNPSQTYSMFSYADLKFPEVVDETGERVRITHGRFVPLEESVDRRVRKEAFEKLYHTYKEYENTLASLYSGQVKQLIFNARARKYSSTLEAAVDANHVSPQVYRNLVETVNANLGKFHRYIRLRKKLLGLEELHMYDIYTPMIPDAARKISYEEAKETILKALAPLGEDYVQVVKRGFEERWVDVYENEGKRSGAYSAGAYGTHPYVLMNYNDSLDNMFTLAHEMGHAMHSYLSNEKQEYIYAEYKIFVAEVASTCNEILLMEYLLNNTTDPKERAYLLNHYLDSFKGTVYRQTMFAEFEMITNAMAEAGEVLTAEVLNRVYLELNEKYYGPDMVSDPEIASEWERIPHFYYNFYVYQYATGFSSAVSIAKNILEHGAPAVEAYKEFLSGGCSEAPVELLKIAGVDLETPKPIQDALQVFEELIEELEQMEM